MEYLLIIATRDSAPYGDEDPEVVTKEYMAFGEDTAARGLLRGGARLRPTADATTVRVRDGEVLTTDGPFAETTEQVAGYYLVDCADLDQAIEVAARIPGARHGSIEVRPLWAM
jgi:hypothetical protein